ncbi:hypothetical protein CBD41_08590 [bacterium TMED181]|nr:MAG: hypothetical protein CBD41_08590 [bacterium TMED181]
MDKIPETTGGQAPQTSFENLELGGSSGHHGQVWSSREAPSVALRSPAMTGFSYRSASHQQHCSAAVFLIALLSRQCSKSVGSDEPMHEGAKTMKHKR